jgi:hypothetical protein
MEMYSCILFTNNNLRFTISLLPIIIKNYFNCYFEKLNDITDIESFIDSFNKVGFSKIIGYLSNDRINIWKRFLSSIMKQNPMKMSLEIHFYCPELKLCYYFYINFCNFGIRIGEENDRHYNDICYKDLNSRIISKSEYDTDKHTIEYIFNLKKYKLNYYNLTEEYMK